MKEELGCLIESLTDEEARLWLLVIRDHDPHAIAHVTAPYDDEPLIPGEMAAADEAWQEYLEGRARPWDEIRDELTRG